MIKLAKIDTMPPKEMLKENYVKKTDEYIENNDENSKIFSINLQLALNIFVLK